MLTDRDIVDFLQKGADRHLWAVGGGSTQRRKCGELCQEHAVLDQGYFFKYNIQLSHIV